MMTTILPSSPSVKATSAVVGALSSGKTISAHASMPIWPHWVSLQIGKVFYEPSSWMPSSLARPRWTNLYVLACRFQERERIHPWNEGSESFRDVLTARLVLCKEYSYASVCLHDRCVSR